MQEENDNIVLNEKSMEVLIAKFIPTSQYFEARFDHLQYQIDEIKEGVKNIQLDMDKRFDTMQNSIDKRFDTMQTDMDNRFEQVNNRFEQVDKRFEQVDKRFEQVDKRFEQVDKRFEQVDKRFEQVDQRFEQINVKLDKLLERIDVKIDKGLAENRSMSVKLFSFAMVFSAISMAGLLGKFANMF